MLKQKRGNAISNGNRNIASNKTLQVGEPSMTKVSRGRYEEQQHEVQRLHTNLNKMQGILKTLNVAALPDKGVLLHRNIASLKEAITTSENQLKRMVIDDGKSFIWFIFCKHQR